ncbi:transcriptional adapter 3-A [Teleopsis dalmanni]|uniref:transcriptional adapter 3-A n=1 Tax=Teleopsis dalmanni TaxID=139649 RepID=UPI0018CF13BD|nr:transcriptional adapter 3-A [Teleopsis dalmanni]
MASKNAKSYSSSNNADAVNNGSIPLIKSKDNAKQLPTYYNVLQRSSEDYLSAEDLDKIQAELETLLSNVALRYRVLKAEYESLDKDERRNERRSKHTTSGEKAPSSPAVQSSSGKRKRDTDTSTQLTRKPKSSVKHIKNAKKSPNPQQHTDDSTDSTPTVVQNTLTVPAGQARSGEHHAPKVTLPKNDTPNKFWLSVEPYCMPITNEDLRLIDDLLEQYTEPLVPAIPELGPHYSKTWAEDDIKDLQQASNPNYNRLKQQNTVANVMLKKGDALVDECVTGSLTQRFISAFMEEQLITLPPELVTNAADSSNSSSENTHSSAQLNFRSLSMMRNCIDIENRLKEELIKQGLLDPDDNNDDEVLNEIKRITNELTLISDYNSKALRQLKTASANEIKRLEIKRKLDLVDQEILETYKRTVQNKAKQKPITAEEQQEVFRLTAEQKSLSDQLQRAEASFKLIDEIKIEKDVIDTSEVKIEKDEVQVKEENTVSGS